MHAQNKIVCYWSNWLSRKHRQSRASHQRSIAKCLFMAPSSHVEKTKTQVAFSLRLGVPLAETLVLGVVARCEGNDHKTCLDYSSQLQRKGWSTSAPTSLPGAPSHSPFSHFPCIPPPLLRPEIAVVLQLRDPPVRTWVLIIGPAWESRLSGCGQPPCPPPPNLQPSSHST